MPQSVTELIDLLDLEEVEVGLFRARQPNTQLQRVFCGQVLAQALVAAARTVPVTRVLHSLHAYFLLAGDPKVPIIYDVERVRDGKSFSTRRVKAVQHGQPIFVSSVSFHREKAGMSHQARMPDVPKPEELPSEAEIRGRFVAWLEKRPYTEPPPDSKV